MDGTAVDRIAELAKVKTMELDGVTVANDDFNIIDTDPSVESISVATLGALRDFIKANVDGLDLKKLLLHVQSESAVGLLTEVRVPCNKRHLYMDAKAEITAFRFGEFMDTETFVIGLQTAFVPGGDIEAVKVATGNIREGKERTVSDDGVSQEVTAKVGVQLGFVRLPSPVTLAPFRTFREVEQPSSIFICRARAGSDDAPPKLALFPADGNRWKLDAIQIIAAWLRKEVPEVTVLA
jgi:hypothetical protein